jgi:GNAT superfamily N-acetyltransferase
MIRKAELNDLPAIMEITHSVVVMMQSIGNEQWDENYPQAKDFIQDIQRRDLYCYERKGKLAAFVCVNKIEPIEYYELSWSLKEQGMIIHRMAVDPQYQRKGLSIELLEFAECLAKANDIRYLKTDTNLRNEKMRSLFNKKGYRFVGEIHFSGKSDPYYCYEKVLV